MSVSELQRRRTTAENSVIVLGSTVNIEGRVGTKKKFDHIVFGPAAGQGLSDRLQCRGMFVLELRSCIFIYNFSMA